VDEKKEGGRREVAVSGGVLLLHVLFEALCVVVVLAIVCLLACSLLHQAWFFVDASFMNSNSKD